MFFVYILYSYSQKFSRYYIGNSENLETGLKQHNIGKTKSTKNFRPWVLVYQEPFETRIEARKREIQIKSYKGGRAFRELLKKGADTEAVKRDRL